MILRPLRVLRGKRERRYAGLACSLLTCALVLLLSGCQAIGGSSPFLTSGEGGGPVYQGVLSLEGSDVAAALEITPTGRRRVRAALQADSGLVADGVGSVRGSALTIELEYGGDCPGRMTLEGDWDEPAGTYRGTVVAQDCTGRGEGTFDLAVH